MRWIPCWQTKYCQAWADHVLSSSKPLRKRFPAALAIWATGSTNSAQMCTPASSRIARLTEHELVDLSTAVRQKQCGKRGRPRLTSRLSIPKGKCFYDKCPRAVENYLGPLPKRPATKCMSCNHGKGAYYHLSCFFCVHRCVLE